MTTEARVARDFEIPLVRWWLRQRFLLLATVFLLLLGLAATLIGALWITRVKEEVPASVLAWRLERDQVVVEVGESRRDRFMSGREVELLWRESPDSKESVWRGKVVQIEEPAGGQAPGKVGVVLRMSRSGGPGLTAAEPSAIRLYIRARRAIDVVRDRSLR